MLGLGFLLRSSGQSRALYKYGIDITNATLSQYAYNLGIMPIEFVTAAMLEAYCVSCVRLMPKFFDVFACNVPVSIFKVTFDILPNN